MKDSKKQENLNKILEKLSTDAIDDTDIGAFSDAFKEIYGEGFRHSYSSVTGIMLRSREENDAVFSYAMDNLSTVIDHMAVDDSDREVVDKVKKLQDHISLESIRYDQLYRSYEDKVADAEKSMKAVEKQHSELKTLEKKTRNEVAQLKTEATQLKTEVVTILSIFAAIVLTFMGGMSFTASTFHGIAETSEYRIIAVSCICGLVIFNTVVALIYLITRIINKPVAMDCETPDCSCEKKCKSVTILRKRYPLIFWFNIMILFLLVADVAAWVVNAERLAEFVQSHIWDGTRKIVDVK